MKAFSTIIAAAVITAGTIAAGAAPVLPRPASDHAVLQASDGPACGFYAIVASGPSYRRVATVATNAGARVLNTDYVDNFRDGLHAAVFGPSSKGSANAKRNQMRRLGYGDAYVKYGCED